MTKHVTINVDGEDLALAAEGQTVRTVLLASGLVPSRYDLERVLPDGSSTTIRDTGTIPLADGDEFVTARISTTTA